jgi:methyl-accepting chemotaxis protein
MESNVNEKILKFQKLQTFFTAGIFVVILVAAIAVVPRAVNLLDQAQIVAEKAMETVENADATLADISTMADSIAQTGEDMNKLIKENESTLTESLDKMSQIDFDGLNKAITDLQDAVGPFASFMNKFR